MAVFSFFALVNEINHYCIKEIQENPLFSDKHLISDEAHFDLPGISKTI